MHGQPHIRFTRVFHGVNKHDRFYHCVNKYGRVCCCVNKHDTVYVVSINMAEVSHGIDRYNRIFQGVVNMTDFHVINKYARGYWFVINLTNSWVVYIVTVLHENSHDIRKKGIINTRYQGLSVSFIKHMFPVFMATP